MRKNCQGRPDVMAAAAAATTETKAPKYKKWQRYIADLLLWLVQEHCWMNLLYIYKIE